MSPFPKNLAILRHRAGYTQESLAEALGISRQAVSKWESGQGLPEAATLLTLADLLDCTLDQLMREELPEGLPDLPAPEVREAEDGWNTYDLYAAHMDRFSFRIALGVALILLGVAALLGNTALGLPGGMTLFSLFLCLAFAVFLFISEGVAHRVFMETYPQIPDLCPPEERSQFKRRFGLGVALAVSGILGGLGLLILGGSLFHGHFSTGSVALFLSILAVCIGILVYLGIQYVKYDPNTLYGNE